MKKLILSLAIATIATLSANAQKETAAPTGGFKFSVGVEGALPLGDLKTSSKFGIGGSLQGEYKAAEDFGVTLNVGYLSFSGKTISDGGFSVKVPTLSLIPILVGGKYYFTESFYGSAQIGVSMAKYSGSSSSSAFTYAPGIGYYLAPNFDILLKYQAASKNGGTLSFLGLRAAYNF